jgi:hypothetical protein
MPTKISTSTRSRIGIDPVVHHGDRDQVEDVHRERDEDERVEVVGGAVPDPGIPDGGHAAFDHLLGLVGHLPGASRLEQVHDRERGHREENASRAEGEHVD